MLDIMKKLDSATIRGLIVATIPLIVMIASLFGADEALFKTKLEGLTEKIVAIISLGGIVWAAYARLFKPTPPLTNTAARATEQLLNKQGGYARFGMLMSLVLIALAVAGCTGTRAAYKQAVSVEDRAFVVAEHYAALVKEAADLAGKPTTSRQAIDAMKRADAAAKPVVRELNDLRKAYAAVKSADDEAKLQKAVNDAILLLADMTRAVKTARGETQ